MAGVHDGWIYQGRQTHMWFGHGTKPKDGLEPIAHEDVGTLAERIHSLGHTLVAGLPSSKRYHDAARLSREDHARLDRVMGGVVHALPLGPRLIPVRVLGTVAGAPGIAAFVQAGGVLKAASGHADLRKATDLVAQSAQEMGLDHFKPFLRRADAHLADTGGMLMLARDVPTPVPPRVAAPPTPPPASPGLPPPGQVMPLVGLALRRAGLLGVTAGLLSEYLQARHEAALRAAIEQFKFHPSNPADMAAAVAYVWARVNRSLLIGTGLPDSALDAVAAQVMRAVRADPTLLPRTMAAEDAALAAIRAAVRGTLLPGTAFTVRNDEERALVTQMLAEGRPAMEIQSALDHHRAREMGETAEMRRNAPGVAVVSTPLPQVSGQWLWGGPIEGQGAPIPAQVAEKLEGRSFGSFGDLREAFWEIVAATPELAIQFTPGNLTLMRRGRAPFAPQQDATLRSEVWELHHDPAIGKGGPVYDLSTITVVTPAQHDYIHTGRRQP